MTTTPPAGLNARQVNQLLAPINTNRVLRDGKGHSHVSQQDVTAHLIRVFGFGNFDVETLDVECVFETPRNDQATRFDVCYRARVRLTIRDEHGRHLAHYEDGSTATAQNQTRGDAHDLAMKSALSLAKKRAAINLGDQFGLSLYNKGQTAPLVIATLVDPRNMTAAAEEGGDVQAEVPQQVTMGDNETGDQPDEPDTPAAQRPGGTRQQGPAAAADPVKVDDAVLKAQTIAVCRASTLGELRAAYDEACRSGAIHAHIVDPDAEGVDTQVSLGEFITRRREQMQAAA